MSCTVNTPNWIRAFAALRIVGLTAWSLDGGIAEKQVAETRPTYYFYRHQDKPFHIDYVFVPKSWRLKSVEVGSFREWGHLSDHVPVVVDVSIRGNRT